MRTVRPRRWLAAPLLAIVTTTTCRDTPSTAPAAPDADAPSVSKGPSASIVATSETTPQVLVGAGDIANCASNSDEATAALLDGIPGTVFTAGDGAYPNGSATDYASCYEPTWGRHKARTKPAVGDRDYNTTNAAGYFGYFGAAAGDPATGYYSYELGDWHVIVLNTKLSTTATSAQVTWLKNDLAASGKACTAVIMHRPYYSTLSGVRTALKPVWDVLHERGVELVVSADNRVYERFAPQDANSNADPANGVRQFIAGLGGASRNKFGTTVLANSEVRSSTSYGVLKLTLSATGYAWEFVPVPGSTTFTDAGSALCHDPAPTTDEPPVARPGGPYTADDVVTLDGSASSDPNGDTPLTYDWDFGDGSPHGTGVAPTHTYAAAGTYTVTLVARDAGGNASQPATTTVTVANVAPTVAVQPMGAAILGTPSTVRVSFTDPGVGDAPWAYSVSWGDGTTTSSTTTTQDPIDLTHDYAAVGSYTVTATVTDKDGGAGSASGTVSVTQAGAAHVLIGAGDIAECGSDWWNKYDEATGDLIRAHPDATVFTAGDNAYPNGRASDYANCYEPAWGSFKGRTWAVLGNHEYDSGSATASFDYFGDRAGPRGKGYYSYDLGDWHVIVLNDNSDFVPFAAGSEQDLWLQNDLATSTKQCTIAIWHQPLTWSQDGSVGYRSSRKIFWDRLYAAGAELVLGGHQHFYERFAPMNPSRVRDDANGIRQIIIGTGGSSVAPPAPTAPNSQVVGVTRVPGVLKLTLRSGSYDWEFLPIPGAPGGTFTDSGTGTCH